MPIGKFLISLLIFSTVGVSFAQNNRDRNPFNRPAPEMRREQRPSSKVTSCLRLLKQRPSSKGREAVFAQYAAYFPDVPEGVRAELVRVIDFNPEVLAIILDLTRGVLDEQGNVVKKPLQASELEYLVDRVFPLTHTALLPSLYNSSLVGRDPILLYEVLYDLGRKINLDPGSLTSGERQMLISKTVN